MVVDHDDHITWLWISYHATPSILSVSVGVEQSRGGMARESCLKRQHKRGATVWSICLARCCRLTEDHQRDDASATPSNALFFKSLSSSGPFALLVLHQKPREHSRSTIPMLPSCLPVASSTESGVPGTYLGLYRNAPELIPAVLHQVAQRFGPGLWVEV